MQGLSAPEGALNTAHLRRVVRRSLAGQFPEGCSDHLPLDRPGPVERNKFPDEVLDSFSMGFRSEEGMVRSPSRCDELVDFLAYLRLFGVLLMLLEAGYEVRKIMKPPAHVLVEVCQDRLYLQNCAGCGLVFQSRWCMEPR